MIEHQYKIYEDGEWSVVELTGYPFKDFYHFANQMNWLKHHYGSPTYSQKYMRVFGDNTAYISILDGKDEVADDPIYRFAFASQADAVNFYLSFV